MAKDKKKTRYKVMNWSEYNASLKKRGSLTFWFSEDFDKCWLAERPKQMKRGRPLAYSDDSIQLMLSLRHLFKLPLRQTTGFVESVFALLNKDLPIPDFSRLSKRSSKALSWLKLPSLEEGTHIVIDSTGLKVYGEKEWLETKHGKQYQRKVWRKIHIGIDKEGKIVAHLMSDHKTDDRLPVPTLLEQMETKYIDDWLADAGYDSHTLYDLLKSKDIRPLIPLPKGAVVTSKEDPSLRDKTVEYMKSKGYWAWYTKNDFGRRNRVENTFYRLKTIFGRKLAARRMENQQAQTHLLCYLLNKMTDLGMPKTVKIS